MSQKLKQQIEQIEESGSSLSFDGSVSVSGTESISSSLADMASGFDVTGFKCTECGLAHMHDTNKHRASDSFDMGEGEAASIDMNPNCHCGVQELGRRGSDFGVDEGQAASIAHNAPISDSASRLLNQRFGSL